MITSAYLGSCVQSVTQIHSVMTFLFYNV